MGKYGGHPLLKIRRDWLLGGVVLQTAARSTTQKKEFLQHALMAALAKF
jgi:hypothetical protein